MMLLPASIPVFCLAALRFQCPFLFTHAVYVHMQIAPLSCPAPGFLFCCRPLLACLALMMLAGWLAAASARPFLSAACLLVATSTGLLSKASEPVGIAVHADVKGRCPALSCIIVRIRCVVRVTNRGWKPLQC